MAPVHREYRITNYSDVIAGWVLLLVVVILTPLCCAAIYITGLIGFVFFLFPAGLLLAAQNQLHARAIGVLFGSQVEVRLIRRTLVYPQVVKWWWFDNDELWIAFDHEETNSSWRIRATWKQVTEASDWLRPDLEEMPDSKELEPPDDEPMPES